MTRTTGTGLACAALLWAGTALAAPTAQQLCDFQRVTAWKVYQACVDTVVAKYVKGVNFDFAAAFARCRHAYFQKWNRFQTMGALAGTTCVGARYQASDGNTTVTDNLTGLVWEQKTDDNRSTTGTMPTRGAPGRRTRRTARPSGPFWRA